MAYRHDLAPSVTLGQTIERRADTRADVDEAFSARRSLVGRHWPERVSRLAQQRRQLGMRQTLPIT